MDTSAIKNARIRLKTTKEARDFLSKAAMLSGIDVSSFILASATDKAHAILQDHASISLSATGQAQLALLLQNQPVPTKAMESLRRLPRLKTISK